MPAATTPEKFVGTSVFLPKARTKKQRKKRQTLLAALSKESSRPVNKRIPPPAVNIRLMHYLSQRRCCRTSLSLSRSTREGERETPILYEYTFFCLWGLKRPLNRRRSPENTGGGRGVGETAAAPVECLVV